MASCSILPASARGSSGATASSRSAPAGRASFSRRKGGGCSPVRRTRSHVAGRRPRFAPGSAWRSASAPGATDELAGARVQGLVHQLVGAPVVRARDVAHAPVVELAERRESLQEERLQAGVLDLVLAADLAGHELGVVDHVDLARAEVAGELEAELERLVLGDVVRRLADVAPLGAQLVAVGSTHDGTDGGGPG